MWLLKVRACKSCIQVEDKYVNLQPAQFFILTDLLNLFSQSFMRTEHFSKAFDKLYSSITNRGGSLFDLLPFHLESMYMHDLYQLINSLNGPLQVGKPKAFISHLTCSKTS